MRILFPPWIWRGTWGATTRYYVCCAALIVQSFWTLSGQPTLPWNHGGWKRSDFDLVEQHWVKELIENCIWPLLARPSSLETQVQVALLLGWNHRWKRHLKETNDEGFCQALAFALGCDFYNDGIAHPLWDTSTIASRLLLECIYVCYFCCYLKGKILTKTLVQCMIGWDFMDDLVDITPDYLSKRACASLWYNIRNGIMFLLWQPHQMLRI